MSLKIFGTKLDQKVKGKPLWPSFRKAFLTGDVGARLTEHFEGSCHTVFWAKGTYQNREGQGGGCYGNVKKDRPMFSFEQRQWALHKGTQTRKPIYLIGWIGEYGNGSIMHLSWQYPHCTNYDEDSLAVAAFNFYEDMARTLYAGTTMDTDVAQFLKNGRQIIQASYG